MIAIEAFEAEVEAFLDANATRRAERTAVDWGAGSDRVAVFDTAPPDVERVRIAEATAWQATRFDAGLGWITGPQRFGGRGLGPEHEVAYRSLERQYEVPNAAPLGALGLVGPTILSHGQALLQDRLLPGLYRGDLIACQLFSEPDAGSDLANVRTRAERDGDSWVITGQKVWSSGAHYADLGEIICRSELGSERHQGLTAFAIDMRAPGVEVRPLRQITGGAHFNEVFLTEVVVDDSGRLGDEGSGWSVALATLLHERAAAGDDWYGSSTTRMAAPDWLAELARRRGRIGDPVVRQRLADLYANYAVTRWWNARMAAALGPGESPGPEMSISKLSVARNMTDAANLAADLLGPAVAADAGGWGTYSWSELLLGAPALHIGGGTDEIMRSILAERVLGLPRDRG